MRPHLLLLAAITFTPISAHAGDDGPKIFFSGPGTLGPGPQGCLIFVADHTGQGYVLDDFGGFLPGQRVFVEGTIDDESIFCFPTAIPGIVGNTIHAFFEGCGTIEFAPQGCFGFVSDDGESHLLQSSHGFGFGEHIFVTGPVVEDSLVCFPIVGPAIEMNTAVACVVGDTDGDGVVAVSDLVNVIQQWGDCPGPFQPCPADLDGDGAVTVQDLVIVLQNWS